MNKTSFPLASLVTAGSRRRPLALGIAALAMVSAAHAVSFYWAGDHNALWDQIGGPGGTNWSFSGDFNSGTPGIPGSGDDVFFNLFGAANLNTVLGSNFSINSLTFTPDATSAVTIGGANTLTLGVGGLTNNSSVAHTISTAVALGVSQTWTNNTSAPLNVSGIIGGGASGLTLSGSGAFVFSGANTYTGATSLSTVGATLTLSGASGSLATTAVSLEGGTTLNFDSSAGDHASNNRLGDTVGISSKGATISLLGSGTTAETVGTLTLTTGLTRVNAGAGTTLIFGALGAPVSFSRSGGATINFGTIGTIKAPNVTLTNGILGGWATIGNPDSNAGANVLDFATVDGSNNVVALGSYSLNSYAAAANNTKDNGVAATTLSAATTTINSLYLTSTARINFNGSATNTLTIGTGGIISNGATQTIGSSGQPDLTNAATIGNGVLSATNTANGVPQGKITSSGPDLIVTAASNLRINAVISGSIGLTKNGAGILDLSNGNAQNDGVGTRVTNTFTGNTTVNAGLLIVNDDLNFGAVPGSYSAGNITLNGGEIRTTRGITLSGTRGVTVGTQGGTISYNGGATFTIGSNSATTTRVTGAGQMTFSSAPNAGNSNTYVLNFFPGGNTYQGATTLNAQQGSGGGTANIQYGQNEQIPDNSAVTVTGNPNTTGGVNINGKTETIGSLAGVSTARIFNHTATLTVGQNNLSTTYAGRIEGTGGILTKVGTGTLTLSGNNTYTGATNINGGTILVTASPTGTGAISVGNAGGTLGGTLGGSGTVAAPVTVNMLGHLAPAILPTGTNTLTIGNNLTMNAGSTLDYNFAAPGSGGVGGTGDLVNLTGTGSLSIAAGADVLNITQLSGFGIGTYKLITVGGSGSFTDNATFTINGKSNFNYFVLKPGDAIDATAGGGTVAAKTLLLQVLQGNPNLTWIGGIDANWNTTTANWSGDNTLFTTGANVTFDDFGTAQPNVVVVGGGVSANTISLANSSVNYAFSGGPITVTAGSGITKTQSGSVTFNTNVTTPITTIGGGAVTVGAGTTYASTVKVDVNSGALAVNGTLNTPQLNVKTGTTLNVASTGSLAATTALSVAGTGAATFNQAAQTLGGLAGTGGLTLNNTALTLNSTTAFDGAIGGNGSLSVTGGTTTLSNGASNYGGGTTISGSSTLFVTNGSGSATGSGAVTVQTGTTLGGTGMVSGNVTIDSGGTLTGTGKFGGAVGISGNLTPAGLGTIGTISLCSLSLDNGAVLNFDFAGLGNNDTGNVAGTLTLGGAETLNVNAQSGFGIGNYPLFTAIGGVTNNAVVTVNATGAAALPTYIYSIITQGTQLLLNVDAATLTWTGATDGNWDTTTNNWSPTSTYSDGYRVNFGDGPTNNTIAISGTVSPVSVAFTNTAPNSYTIGGGMIAGAAGILKTGDGPVTLTGANTFTGATIINNGVLNISAENNLGAVPAAFDAAHLIINGGRLATTASLAVSANRGVQVGSSATVDVATGTTLGVAGVIANVPAQTGVLTKVGNGELDLNAANTFSGGVTVNGGIVRLGNSAGGGTGAITVNPNTILGLAADSGGGVILAGGTIGVTGAAHTLSGNLTAATGTTSTVDIFDPIAGNTPNDFFITGTLHGSGTINIASQNAPTPDSSAFRLRGTTPSDFTGTIFVGMSGKVELQSSVTGLFSPAGSGTIVLTGGTIDNSNNGNFSIMNARNNSTGDVTFGNNLEVTGTGLVLVNMLGSSPTDSKVTYGNLKIGANQSLAAGATSGGIVRTLVFDTVTLTGGAATFVPRPVGNTAYVVSDNISLGNISESAAGSGLIANGAATLTLTGANTFTGTVAATNGTLVLNSATANSAIPTDNDTTTTSDVLINGGALRIAASEQIGDAGSIFMSSGSLGFNGSGLVETIDKLTVSGGTLNTGANQLIVGGATVTWSGGTSTIATGGLISDKHWVVTGGTNTVQQNGLLWVRSGSGTAGLIFGGTSSPTITFDSHASLPGALLLEQNVTVDSSLTSGTAQILNGGVAVMPGVINLSGGTRTFSVNDGAAASDLLISASLQNGAIIKTDAGTMTLTGANTFSGTTTINGGTLEAGAAGALSATPTIAVNAGGTLLLSGTGDRVNDSAGVILDGGTLNSGGLSETVGTLTLTNSSIVDFGSGASILHFADSSALTWTGTLSIYNWSGNQNVGGGTDQLFFGDGTGTGLTGSQLSQIKFYSDAGSTLLPFAPGFSAFTGGFGEVVPVPEPSSVATVMSLLGLAGWRERRKMEAARRSTRKFASNS